MKASEGMAYNVVSCVPKDAALVEALETKALSSTLARVRPGVEAYTRAAADAAEDLGTVWHRSPCASH